MVIHFGTIRLDLHFEDLLTSFKGIFHLRINSCHRSKDGWAGAQCCCKERHGVQVKNFQGDASGGFWSQPPKQIKQKINFPSSQSREAPLKVAERKSPITTWHTLTPSQSMMVPKNVSIGWSMHGFLVNIIGSTTWPLHGLANYLVSS